ncbi:MAG: nucleoside deaminase [Pseudoclavibacter sp.]
MSTIASARARHWLSAAVDEARAGRAEGGQPVGSVLIDADGRELGRGRNRFVQTGVLSAHAEIEAFRVSSALEDYGATTMVTTAEPCWLCAGLVRQFGIGRVVVGAEAGFGTLAWLESHGVEVVRVGDSECVAYLDELLAGGAR